MCRTDLHRSKGPSKSSIFTFTRYIGPHQGWKLAFSCNKYQIVRANAYSRKNALQMAWLAFSCKNALQNDWLAFSCKNVKQWFCFCAKMLISRSAKHFCTKMLISRSAKHFCPKMLIRPSAQHFCVNQHLHRQFGICCTKMLMSNPGEGLWDVL